MTKKICSIPGCARAHNARGWCSAHYHRWRRTGRTGGEIRNVPSSHAESFASNVERSPNGCLVWTGSRSDTGYGRISVQGSQEYAHRYAWEREHGAIPDDKMVDHICCNRACVEVGHLRIATNQENSWNRAGANPNSASGVRGVIHEGGNSYVAQVKKDGRIIRRFFSTHEEAAAAAPLLRAELFGNYAGTEVT